jgi:hypothetical protein
MAQEIGKLEEMIEKQDDLLEAQEVYLALDKQKVIDNFDGVKFDNNTGEIVNYTEMVQ